MRRVSLLWVLLAVSSSACYRTIRASSLEQLPREQSSVRLETTVDALADALGDLMTERGFPIVNKIEGPPGRRYYIFKGNRRAVTTVRGNSSLIVAQTVDVGSWYVARITSTGSSVELLLMGKPTVNGTEVCSNGDSELADGHYWCKDTSARQDWPGLPLVSGREESELVRGVLLTVARKFPAGR